MEIFGGLVPLCYVEENWSFILSRSTQCRLGVVGGEGTQTMSIFCCLNTVLTNTKKTEALD